MGQRLVNARLAVPFCCLTFEVFVTWSLTTSFGKVACPGEGKGASGGWGGCEDGVGGRDVSLSIAPQSGELQAQCSEHERQRA